MKIIQSKRFCAQLSKIVEFIAERSGDAAENFKNELFARAGKLGFMPYKFRRSKSFDDDRIRDFIFKGFVIPYLIDEPNDTIVILAIFKQNLLR